MNSIPTTRTLRSILAAALLTSALFLFGAALGLDGGGKTLAATPAADLYTHGWAEPYYVLSGGQVNFAIFVGNAGPTEASNVTLTGEFPSGVTFDGAVSNNGSCAGTPGGAGFSCSFPTVNADETETISVSATATGQPYTLLAATLTVTSDTFDGDGDNNAAVVQFYIASPPLPTPTPGPTNEARLAYLSSDQSTFENDIFRQRADGAGLLNLTNNAAGESGIVWSPDGSRLGFLSYDYASLTVSFCVVDTDGSNVTVLANVPGEYISSFAWSPDGGKLIFSVLAYSGDTPTGEVYVINVDGTGRVNVSGTDGYNTEPAWSPDGTRVSFTRRHYLPGSVPTSDVYVAVADGTNQLQIAHADGEMDFGAVWSPDGTRLAFSRFLADDTGHVYTVRPDGSDVSRLISDPDVQTFSPQWSPDGGKLSFSSYGPGGSAIETINADGSGRATIYSPPQGGLYYGINGWRWSPDGTKLAFGYIVGEGQGANVCVVNADGTGLHCLGSNDLEYNCDAVWSPDGARLAFTSLRNGVASIDLINADGTGRVELTLDGYEPRWQPTGTTPP